MRTVHFSVTVRRYCGFERHRAPGAAESRPPAPINMAPMRLPKDDGLSFEMAARRGALVEDGATDSLLSDDAQLEDYEFEDDDDVDANPFAAKKGA